MTDWLVRLAAVDTRWLLVVFLAIVDVWSMVLIARSDTSLRQKIAWSGVVVLCPIVGCVYWYVLGPKPTLSRAPGGQSG